MEDQERKQLKTIVIFDDHCPMCKILADYARARCDFEFLAFSDAESEIKSLTRKSLTVRLGESDFKFDADAWQWLIQNHPSLASLNWIAEKLNMQPTVAKGVSKIAQMARAFCWKCKQLFI